MINASDKSCRENQKHSLQANAPQYYVYTYSARLVKLQRSSASYKRKEGRIDLKQNSTHFRILILSSALVLTSHLDLDLRFPIDFLPGIIQMTIMRATRPAYNISALRILRATRVCGPLLLHPHTVHTSSSVHCSQTLLSHCMTTYSHPSKTEGKTSIVHSYRFTVGHWTDKKLKRKAAELPESASLLCKISLTIWRRNFL